MRADAADEKTLPQALLCDLDDTILDDTSARAPAWRRATEWASRQAEGLDSEALFQAVLRSVDWYWSNPERHKQGRIDLNGASATIVGMALTELGIDRPDLASGAADMYRDIRSEGYRPFPGAVEALETLLARGVRLGLITNGGASIQRWKLERLDLTRYFEHVHIEGEEGFGKPDPRVYEGAMEALGAGPDRTWCVGDNLEWEVAAPQRLGIYSIWMDLAREGLPDGTSVKPDRIVSSLSELLP